MSTAGTSAPVVVAIANEAGSAGKTSTAVNIAAMLAATGRTVRLIDLDAQANATWWLGYNDTQYELTSGDVLARRASLDDATLPTTVPGLTLVPANHALTGVTVELSRELGPEQRLRMALAASSTQPEITIIDCPGALGTLTLAAMVAATAVVTVSTPSTKEIGGISRVLATTEEVAAAYNPQLRVAAIVPCNVPPPSAGRLYVAALTHLGDSWPDLVTTPVRRSVRVPEAYTAQTPLHIYAPTEPVTDDYHAVVHDLESRLTLPVPA